MVQAHIRREELHVVTGSGDRFALKPNDAKASIRNAGVLKGDPPGVPTERLPGRRHVAAGVDQHPLGAPLAENLDGPVHDVSLGDPVECHCHPGLLERDLAVAHADVLGSDERQRPLDLLSRRGDSGLGKARIVEVEQRGDRHIERTGGQRPIVDPLPHHFEQLPGRSTNHTSLVETPHGRAHAVPAQQALEPLDLIERAGHHHSCGFGVWMNGGNRDQCAHLGTRLPHPV